MRAERLIRTLLVLQRKGRVTAAELAVELEVSVATARRDFEALAGAGIPVYPQVGRGGGWRLLGGARTDLTGLTQSDVIALFRVLGRSSPQATRKLLQAVPEPFRVSAARVAESTIVDPAPWGHRRDLPAAVEHALDRVLDAVLEAIATRRCIVVCYEHADARTEELTLHPWATVDKAGRSYLLASGGSRRVFRVDRIRAVELSGERAERPTSDEIEAAWADESRRIEELRTRERVVLRADDRAIAALRAQFGDAMTVDLDGKSGVLVHIATSSTWMAAMQLAGHAEHVEVLEPVEVRDELRRVGAALLRRYG